MKKTLFFLLSIFILSCNQQKTKQSESLENKIDSSNINENKENFNWLIGYWERSNNNEEEEKTFEIWKKETDNRFAGHGFVMKGLDTIWQERMILSKKDSDWILAVETPGNNDLTEFTLTEHNTNSFTVQNPNHDFPKEIKYWKSKNQLHALVSGNEKEINFDFNAKVKPTIPHTCFLSNQKSLDSLANIIEEAPIKIDSLSKTNYAGELFDAYRESSLDASNLLVYGCSEKPFLNKEEPLNDQILTVYKRLSKTNTGFKNYLFVLKENKYLLTKETNDSREEEFEKDTWSEWGWEYPTIHKERTDR